MKFNFALRNTSLRTRIFLLCAGLVLLVGGLTASVSISQQRFTLQKLVILRGTTLVTYLANSAPLGLLTGFPMHLKQHINSLSKESDLAFAAVYDTNSAVFISTGELTVRQLAPWKGQKSSHTSWHIDNHGGQKVYDFHIAIYGKGQLTDEQLLLGKGEDSADVFLGWARVGIYAAAIEQVVRGTLIRTLTGLLVLLGACVVLAWGVSAALLTPLNRLGQAALQVAEGNLDIYIDSEDGDEVAALAANFNTMIATLRQRDIRLAQQSQWLTAINNMLISSLSTRRLGQILEQVLDEVSHFKWYEMVPKGLIFLTLPDQQHLHLAAAHGFVEGEVAACRSHVPEEECVCNLARGEMLPLDVHELTEGYFAYLPTVIPHEHVITPIFSGDQTLRGALVLYLRAGWEVDEVQQRFLSTFCGAVAGIIERQEAEESVRMARQVAETANKAKSQFLAKMSHEIRTPLHAVIGLGQLLAETKLDEEQSGFLAQLDRSADHLLDVINDILDFSKIEAGKMLVARQEFNIDTIVESVISVLRGSAEDKNLSLEFNYERCKSLILVGDAVRLRQVLVNLLSNAIKFTDTGSVRLLVEPVGQGDGTTGCRFSVEDTGIGMETAHMEHVFQEFNQADDSISRRFGGTGLGLSISRHLVSLMGGELCARSAMGVGSVFYFEIPLVLKG